MKRGNGGVGGLSVLACESLTNKGAVFCWSRVYDCMYCMRCAVHFY